MKKIVLHVIMFSSAIIAMDESQQPAQLKPLVLAIPGQNGLGSSPEYVRSLLGDVTVREVSTPWPPYADLGQSQCISHLKKTIDGIPADQQAIIHATSQGTATALNYLAEDKGKKIKAMILEASLASGNSAIYHTVSGPLMGLEKVAHLPGSYYLMPYIARFLMPFYSPSGKQPIKAVEDIPNHIPIIFAHSKQDMQLAYTDSCALYYKLRSNGNDNVYFITKKDDAHIKVLKSSMDTNPEPDIQALREILHTHNIIYNSSPSSEINMVEYQPDPAQFKQFHDELLAREKKHTILGWGLTTGAVAALAVGTYKLFQKYKHSPIVTNLINVILQRKSITTA